MWFGESGYVLGVNGEIELLKYLMFLIRYNYVYILDN